MGITNKPINFKDKEVIGRTIDETIIKARMLTPLSLRQIGKQMECSGQNIWARLQKYKHVPELYEVLMKKPSHKYDIEEVEHLLDKYTTAEVSAITKIPYTAVRNTYYENEIDKKTRINVSLRRTKLVHSLFDNEDLIPGPNFLLWLEEQLAKFRESIAKKMRDFYIYGRKVSFNQRVSRVYIKQQIKENIKESLEDLLEKDIIRWAKK